MGIGGGSVPSGVAGAGWPDGLAGEGPAVAAGTSALATGPTVVVLGRLDPTAASEGRGLASGAGRDGATDARTPSGPRRAPTRPIPAGTLARRKASEGLVADPATAAVSGSAQTRAAVAVEPASRIVDGSSAHASSDRTAAKLAAAPRPAWR
jgi:hypothetical protein